MVNRTNLATGISGHNFEGQYDDEEITRALQIFLQYNALALIKLPDGTFTIRLHDEITRGGIPLSIMQTPVADPIVATSFADLLAICPLAPGVPVAPFMLIDCDTSAGDFVLTGWAPTCLAPNTIVRVRKINTGGGAIEWKDSTIPYIYKFVSKQGEFMTFVWSGSKFHII
jgi:hypothetical protein